MTDPQPNFPQPNFPQPNTSPKNARRNPPATPSIPLERHLADLAACDLAGLRKHWQDRWGAPPPLRSVDLLRLSLAWRLQAEALGGHDRVARRQIARTGRLQPEGQELGLGARLRREWQGRMVEVVVTAEGFRWEDRTFPNLSAAATAITGTRWNGPRFFGLRRGAK